MTVARRIAIAAFAFAAAFPALFVLVIAIDSMTGCPDGCGIFESPLRLLGTISYFGMFFASPLLFLIGALALAVHALVRR